MANKPYPLRFQPFFRDYLWGGRKLQTRLNKALPVQGNWAESWEVVDHADHESLVVQGTFAGRTLGQLVREHHEWLFGCSGAFPRFPLLFKYLDCQTDLSVQVHPDDQYAMRMNPPDLGKTEAWYIIDAVPGSIIYAGLRDGVRRQDLLQAIQAGETQQCLQTIYPQTGDCVFIPAGTVHALGAGLLVAEIQQASNTTFRLFDWNRVDSEGKSRPLHIEQALDTIDFSRGPCMLQQPHLTAQPGRTRLVKCDKFHLDLIHHNTFTAGDGNFHLLTVPQGHAEIHWEDESLRLSIGETVLLPAHMPQTSIVMGSESVLLDVYL